MRNISYYIFGVVLLGALLVSFWVYQTYFKTESQAVIAFKVVRSEIREAVNVRGEVVSQKEFDLEFPFGGKVEKIFVKEGEIVKSGDSLMRLETTDLDAEYGRLEAVMVEQQAMLEKLTTGAQTEEIRILEAKVSGAEQVLGDSKRTLVDSVRSAFTVADDAVYNKADQFFDNPRSANPLFEQTIADTQLKINLEAERYRIGLDLNEWSGLLPKDITRALLDAENALSYLSRVKALLVDMASAINSLSPSGSTTQTTLDVWKTNILSARTSVDAAMAAINAAQEKVRTAESAVILAERELALKSSVARSEDVTIAEARIDQTKHALDAISEKIRKSTLRAPGAGAVKKIFLEQDEIFKPGMTALLFSSTGFKIQSDVSELDISKVRYVNGSDALIRFDAFSGKTFKGKVVFIEPKEIIKNEDIYFRTDIYLDSTSGTEIRSGMSADVVLYGIKKSDVLTIPALAVERKGGIPMVKVAREAKTKEEVDVNNLVDQEITTGVSDGESIEVISGLKEGDIVVVSSE